MTTNLPFAKKRGRVWKFRISNSHDDTIPLLSDKWLSGIEPNTKKTLKTDVLGPGAKFFITVSYKFL
jgi:hypothetical protein